VQAFLHRAFAPDESGWSAFARNALVFTAISVIEPLYVASGFALYLNRRTNLEAWDLELAFRRIEQEAAPSPQCSAVLLACCMIAGLAWSMPQPAFASPATSRETIREVLSGPEFQEFRDQKVWRARNEGNASSQQKPPSSTALFEATARALAQVARIAAFMLVAAALFFAIRTLLRAAGNWTPAARPPPDSPRPDTVFGLDVRPEALPPNLVQVAAEAARHDPRLALGLLYRGALAALIHRERLPIHAGDTEGDCLRRVRTAGSADRSAYFAKLVDCWSETAYAGSTVEASTIESLCTDWPRFFLHDREDAT
jgi:hypothetical protein